MTMDERIEALRRKQAAALEGGGEARVAAQHEKGKRTARERLEAFLDDGTFHEFDQLRTQRNGHGEAIYGDGVVTGYGEVDGRTVFVFAHDFTVYGGSLGEVFAEKVCKVMDKAVEVGAPIVGLNDSAGARIQEGVASLAGYGDIFQRNTRTSGVVPQLSAIMGPCAGGAVYSPALTDFVVMVEDTSHMFITGPDVIETVTGEQVTFEELGGAITHAGTSGVATLAAPDEAAALEDLRRLLSYLPQNNLEDPPRRPTVDPPTGSAAELEGIVPDQPQKPYDVTAVVERLVDADSFFELQPRFAANIVIGFARLDGRAVGVVANQPRVNAGTLDIEASVKAARFVRVCDAFNLPICTLVDVPGFMPGTGQEHGGIIRHGAKLLYAYSEATVPLLTVILRKAYGGAYDVMASKHLGADVNYAWPTAELAVMGPRGAVSILHDDVITDADDPDAKREELIAEYREEYANPYTAADLGFLDAVIAPAETRDRLVDDLGMLAGKRASTPPKAHGNIPL